MAINFDNAIGVHAAALKLRSQRAEVLSNNLANINTPNFKARDMDFKQALGAQVGRGDKRVYMTATRAGHIGFDQQDYSSSELLYRTPGQPSIDGNTVEEHVEHAEYMKNSLEFQTAFTFLNSRFKGMKKALSGE